MVFKSYDRIAKLQGAPYRVAAILGMRMGNLRDGDMATFRQEVRGDYEFEFSENCYPVA